MPYALLLLFLFSSLPMASAELGMEDYQNTLFLACDADDECDLNNAAAGEETITGDASQASPLTPKTIILTFKMEPSQTQMALLPDIMRELVVDLRVREDALGWNQPDLDVYLRLGANEQEWSLSGSGVSPNLPAPYRIEDEPLDLSAGRMLRPNDMIELRITFVLDRPANWELQLRGASSFTIPIEWSVNPATANVDEPSSDSQPRYLVDVETSSSGALVDGDRDCWEFNLPKHEIFSITITWYNVPIEVEQPHDPPEIIGENNRRAEKPEVRTTFDGDKLVMAMQYRGLAEGDYSACWGGLPGHFQEYKWYGRFAHEGMGPTDPSHFTGDAIFKTGTATMGDDSKAVELEEVRASSLFIGLILIVLILGSMLMMPTSKSRGAALSIALVLILIGGVVNPIITLGEEARESGEIEVEELLERHMEAIWQVSSPSVDGQTKVEVIGSTLGVRAGEEINLIMPIDEATPLYDGRWQLHTSELENKRIDNLVFDFLAKRGISPDSDGSMPQQAVDFILHAGRAITLDMLLLEAILVVDDLPNGAAAHIKWTMVSATSTGPSASPAWNTRPNDISLADWAMFQRALYPDSMAISYCDCGLDELDFAWGPSDSFDADDMVTSTGIITANGVTEWGTQLLTAGAVIVLLVGYGEKKRRDNARELAYELAYSSPLYSGTSDKWK